MERSCGRLMLIKLTNSHHDHLGNFLILNTEMIVNFFPGKNEHDEDVTFAFGVGGNTWQVKETADEIMSMIKG